MAFDFQLRFTGLNVLAVKQNHQGKPIRADLLMLKTSWRPPHKHVPSLLFHLKNLANESELRDFPDHRLIPTDDGTLVEIPLWEKSLQLRTESSGGDLEMQGKPNQKDPKKHPNSFYLIPSIGLLNIKEIAGDVLSDNARHPYICAHVNLPYGKLGCDNVVKQNGKPVQFQVLTHDGQLVDKTAIANFGTLDIRKVNHVQIKDDEDRCLELGVGSHQVAKIAASVVNLPPRFPKKSNERRLYHLHKLYKLSSYKVLKEHKRHIVAPGLIDTPGSEACPNTTHLYQ